ncbi:hypothetical protein M422DRAFT_209334 [Sphaerobolus stellatus SS14]|uniref:J domain-containing protein n=1 Tax=Sphaerobolus stellatus (strain SS14) TaxID=990650 RepID=A0A0C9V2G8_SPHS4|nr:hypothetical protein M422DRAFT_209334 [Sphaerobolus stellatus SS14]
MAQWQSSITEAYEVLGLQNGATLETVKTTYKQLALKTHPDKNPDDPNATVEFQRIGNAYRTITKHLEKLTHSDHTHSHFSRYSDEYYDEYDYEDDDDDYSDGDYYGDEYDLPFFVYMFQDFLNGHSTRNSGARFRATRVHPFDLETEEEYQDRLKRMREEKAEAEARRTKEEEEAKRRRQQEREEEILAGQQRRKKKAEAKKAESEASRQSAAQKLRLQQEKSQKLRFAAFEAARKGNAAAVKKAVWENGVDASGGELKPGMEDFVQNKPKDPRQTLLHIAVIRGDVELVEWLDTHNAEADERDSQNLTAFHVALQYGHIPIIRYFLETYPPKEEDSGSVLRHPEDAENVKPLLRLALQSGEPEVVWFVLDSELANKAAIREAWSWLTVQEREARAEFGRIGKPSATFDEAKWAETHDLLMSWGQSTPPMTPKQSKQTAAGYANRVSSTSKIPNQMPTPPESPVSSRKAHGGAFRNVPQCEQSSGRGRGRSRGRGRGGSTHVQS